MRIKHSEKSSDCRRPSSTLTVLSSIQSAYCFGWSWAAGGFRLPGENYARMDEVKQPAGAQASPPRGPPKTRWELHHAEDEMQLSWVSEAGAVEKDPQRL